MAGDKNAQLRNLIVGYGDSMRLSDIKALIAVLFVAIMMLTVVQYRERYPWYLSVPVILTPFMIIYLSLLISVYPRFPRAGRKRFPIWRNPDPEDFDTVLRSSINVSLAMRCGSSGWAASTVAKSRLTLPESSCRILLGELDGASKLGERLAGPVDVVQQSVGAVRCHDLMAGSRGDDHLPAGGLRQLFVVPDYPKDFEGCESPLWRV
jgi:hypothetical protein